MMIRKIFLLLWFTALAMSAHQQREEEGQQQSTSEFMRALVVAADSDGTAPIANPLAIRDVARVPLASAEHALVRVAATAVNRIDCLQRSGRLAAPPNESDIIGVEMSGTVVEVGANADGVKVGQRVMALLGGGGYGEFVSVHSSLLMSVPDDIELVQAAALPEVWLTAFQALDRLAPLRALVADNARGDLSVLVHAGGSGVGTALIQLAKHMGAARVLTTSSDGKRALCESLGADVAIDRRANDGRWAQSVLDATDGRGADVIIDFVGGPYWQQNLDAVAADGYIVLLGFLGGPALAAADEPHSLAAILRKRLTIVGSTLRTRPLPYKRALTNDFWQYARAKFVDGTLKPIVDRVLPVAEATQAHQLVESNQNAGKIVLQW
jgi:putative PIG3 family NAD(P)H quinone oxidoreductase